MEDFDFAVVGKGLFGSAAARRLSDAGANVVLVGPDEPAPDVHDAKIHSSHHDQGRLTRRTSQDRLWSEMTERTFQAIQDLEAATGRTIHMPVGSLSAHADSVATRHGRELFESPSGPPLDVTTWESGDRGWRDAHPMFDLPDSCSVRYEGPPAGVLNPRELVAAQVEVAERNGAEVRTDVVARTRELGQRVRLELGSGDIISAGRVLVATGAYTNLFSLLDVPVATHIETETVLLATVSNDDGKRLTSAPTVTFSIDDPLIADIYMTPPLVYPDGRWKVKMGCNTAADSHPSTLDEVVRWFNGQAAGVPRGADIEESMINAVKALWPNLEFIGFESKPCIITMTSTDNPIIDQVSDRRFVAVGGNGVGAKSSDGWGGLGADLMLGRPWPDWIRPELLGATQGR